MSVVQLRKKTPTVGPCADVVLKVRETPRGKAREYSVHICENEFHPLQRGILGMKARQKAEILIRGDGTRSDKTLYVTIVSISVPTKETTQAA